MIGLAEQVERRYSLEEIEAALLAVPDRHWVAALRFGLSEQDGCRMARAQHADDVMRRLRALKSAK